MSVTIWRVTDGKAGHDTQSQGLCAALSQLSECQTFDVLASSIKITFFDLLKKTFPIANEFSNPDIIIGAGHKTHLPLLAGKRAYNAKTIVLMKPSLPLSLFDFCLIPEHDMPPDRANVMKTKGAINDMQPGQEKRNEILILIGGPSRHMQWADISDQIRQICDAHPEQAINITDSPRTPDGFLSSINIPIRNELQLLPHYSVSRSTLRSMMQRATQVWVSMDSISMIYEALTAGAKVGLLELEANSNSRVNNSVQSLINNKQVMTFSEWLVNRSLHPAVSFNEALRCAKLLLQQGLCDIR